MSVVDAEIRKTLAQKDVGSTFIVLTVDFHLLLKMVIGYIRHSTKEITTIRATWAAILVKHVQY